MDLQTKIINWLLRTYHLTIEDGGNYNQNLDLEFFEIGKMITIDTSEYTNFKQAKKEISYLIAEKIFNID